MTDQEINEAVARKLGWNLGTFRATMRYEGPAGISDAEFQEWITPEGIRVGGIPDYCHSIAAAWEIVEFLHADELHTISIYWHATESVSVQIQRYLGMQNPDHGPSISADAATAPMAICLAFLKLP
jgi:hypothetical protein